MTVDRKGTPYAAGQTVLRSYLQGCSAFMEERQVERVDEDGTVWLTNIYGGVRAYPMPRPERAHILD